MIPRACAGFENCNSGTDSLRPESARVSVFFFFPLFDPLFLPLSSSLFFPPFSLSFSDPEREPDQLGPRLADFSYHGSVTIIFHFYEISCSLLMNTKSIQGEKKKKEVHGKHAPDWPKQYNKRVPQRNTEKTIGQSKQGINCSNH